MEQPFNPADLRTKLDRLSPRGRIVFLLSCAERLAPNYSAFSTHHGWGDAGALQQALELGWRYLFGQKVDAGEVHRCLARCEAATPDTEDFDSEYVSSGLDAIVCCAFVLELLIEDNSQKVVEGASLARDTVDMHIQEAESLHPQDPALEEKIFRHPLMQRELQRQREDLEMLTQIDLAGDDIEELSRRWRDPPVSNIGRLRMPG
jgi:uncharacterized protein